MLELQAYFQEDLNESDMCTADSVKTILERTADLYEVNSALTVAIAGLTLANDGLSAEVPRLRARLCVWDKATANLSDSLSDEMGTTPSQASHPADAPR